MAKKRGLGRPLDALLGGASTQRDKAAAKSAAADPVADSTVVISETDRPPQSAADKEGVSGQSNHEGTVINEHARSASGDTLKQIAVDRIRRGTYQPRQHFDQTLLQELADSLLAQGMIQPILVRPFADGYEIIAGERRWRAAQLAGIHEIPAIIRNLDDKSVAAVSLIENIQRKDLNPLEEARALQRLQTEFGMTHQSVAEAVGRSRASVTNLLRLLDLHDEVKVLLDKGDLDMGHARALLGVSPARQVELAQLVVSKGLSVRATEALVKADKAPADKSPAAKVRRDPDIVTLEKNLGEKLGAGVSINHHDSGRGKLEITYTSLDELEGILAHIK